MIDLRLAAFCHRYLDNIEAPREIPCAEALEPGVGSALDQALLFPVHRIKSPDFAAFAAGLYLDKKEQFSIPCHDIDLATSGASIVFRQDFATTGPQPVGGDFFTQVSDPDTVAGGSVRPRQAAGRVERPAETTDDGGDKGRESVALQDVPSCHIPDVSQSRIVETHHQSAA